MKISIVTVVRNNPGIRQALQSIVAQKTDFPVEIIVIDGQSTDTTLDRVREFGDRISVLVSEPDSGIYDAMNKGLGRATGDVVGFLNSDDTYMKDDVLQAVGDAFRAGPHLQAVYGDIIYTHPDSPDKVVRYWSAAGAAENIRRNGWAPPHPGFFARRDCLVDAGGFDTSYRIAGDFELLLRLFASRKIQGAHLPVPLVNMRLGGASNGSIRNILRGNLEIRKAFRKNRVHMPLSYFPRKLIARFLQFRR